MFLIFGSNFENFIRYKMIRHNRDHGNEDNPKRYELIQKTHATMKTDGLNTLKYHVNCIL